METSFHSKTRRTYGKNVKLTMMEVCRDSKRCLLHFPNLYLPTKPEFSHLPKVAEYSLDLLRYLIFVPTPSLLTSASVLWPECHCLWSYCWKPDIYFHISPPASEVDLLHFQYTAPHWHHRASLHVWTIQQCYSMLSLPEHADGPPLLSGSLA